MVTNDRWYGDVDIAVTPIGVDDRGRSHKNQGTAIRPLLLSACGWHHRTCPWACRRPSRDMPSCALLTAHAFSESLLQRDLFLVTGRLQVYSYSRRMLYPRRLRVGCLPFDYVPLGRVSLR